MTHKLYFTENNKPLLATQTFGVPVISLENYEKWYRIYVLQPDGTVERVDPGLILELDRFVRGAAWIDHVFSPELLLVLAAYYGGVVDIVSLEVAAGRWGLEEKGFSDDWGYYLEEGEEDAIKAYRKNIEDRTVND